LAFENQPPPKVRAKQPKFLGKGERMFYRVVAVIKGDFLHIGYVAAESEKAALDKLGLVKMPSCARLIESKEITGFDELMAQSKSSLGMSNFVIYCEHHFKDAKKA